MAYRIGIIAVVLMLLACTRQLSHAEPPTPGNGYDPCLSPERAILELVDKGNEVEKSDIGELISYLVQHCKMELGEVDKIFTTMINFKRQENLSKRARQGLLNPEPYLGLYKRSLIATQEWDMVALFGNSRNQASCLGAIKVIQAEVDSSGEYRCVNLPEDWRKHSIDEVVGRSIRLDE